MLRIAYPLVFLAAGGLAVAFTYVLLPLVGTRLASTLAMGIGVGLAVYLDRRWLRRFGNPAREALTYGAATAAGWGIAQAVIELWG